MHREYLTGYAQGLGLPGIVVYLRCNGRYNWEGYFYLYRGYSLSLAQSLKRCIAALKFRYRVENGLNIRYASCTPLDELLVSSHPTCQDTDDVISYNLDRGDQNEKV